MPDVAAAFRRYIESRECSADIRRRITIDDNRLRCLIQIPVFVINVKRSILGPDLKTWEVINLKAPGFTGLKCNSIRRRIEYASSRELKLGHVLRLFRYISACEGDRVTALIGDIDTRLDVSETRGSAG